MNEQITTEIEKVKRRIPRWLRKEDSQINSFILLKYLELLEEGKPISKKRLKYECENYVRFDSNFNQMVNFGQKNHSKVFQIVNQRIYLWKPVADFILQEYKYLYH
ncbi:hypothetical protein ACTS9U_03895 [Empedobacter falsenii]|uniref:hypothetical protein n=1 Tax=unclassified Empedobacter TaxID=2643773 RepID=UPI0025BD345C|nr:MULTISPECIES: hypothetical protein [unclassified Empedobacter]